MKRCALCVLAVSFCSSLFLLGAPNSKSTAAVRANPVQPEFSAAEGEQRYRANCSRCHQAPPKFAPGAMSTVIRHMRVRAMITDADMRAILKYMTQ